MPTHSRFGNPDWIFGDRKKPSTDGLHPRHREHLLSRPNGARMVQALEARLGRERDERCEVLRRMLPASTETLCSAHPEWWGESPVTFADRWATGAERLASDMARIGARLGSDGIWRFID